MSDIPLIAIRKTSLEAKRAIIEATYSILMSRRGKKESRSKALTRESYDILVKALKGNYSELVFPEITLLLVLNVDTTESNLRLQNLLSDLCIDYSIAY